MFVCTHVHVRLGYIQAPPKRVKRRIYLEPTESKYGLHLAVSRVINICIHKTDSRVIVYNVIIINSDSEDD